MRRLALEEYLEIQRAVEAAIRAEFEVQPQRSELHRAIAMRLEPFVLVHSKDFPERIGHNAVMRLTEGRGIQAPDAGPDKPKTGKEF